MDRIARYKIPESYEFTEDYLRDDAGKVRRSALRDERVAWLREGRPFRTDAKSGTLEELPPSASLAQFS